jgi:hypothetical protein
MVRRFWFRKNWLKKSKKMMVREARLHQNHAIDAIGLKRTPCLSSLDKIKPRFEILNSSANARVDGSQGTTRWLTRMAAEVRSIKQILKSNEK